MERIKQALEKARLEREASDASNIAQKSRASTSRSGDPEEQFSYTRTSVQAVSPDVLKGNRVLDSILDDEAARSFKVLRTQVLQRLNARGWNILAVTSPTPGDGKSLVAVNLAISLANEHQYTTLLADGDLRNPSIHRYFGITPAYGLADFLVKDVPIADILVNPGIDRLVLLPSISRVTNSSELLSSPKMGRLIEEMKSRYPSRIIIFDMPPILMSDDVLAFAPFVDAAILVIRDGVTTKSAIEQSLHLLKDTTILGTVLNDSNEPVQKY